MSTEITVKRSLHNREFPYTPVVNELLDDFNISTDLKMLLIYCLREHPDKKLSMIFFLARLKLSKRSIYRILEEGIKHGYIQRTSQKYNGKFQNTTYEFAESPIFKKLSPCAKNRHAINGTQYINTRDTNIKLELEPSTNLEARADIDALPFAQNDKSFLYKYPEEAIAYAINSLNAMKSTPDRPIAVFTSLCNKYVTQAKELTKIAKLNESRCSEARAWFKNIISQQPALKYFFYEKQDQVAFDFRKKREHISFSDPEFQEKFNDALEDLCNQ